MAVADYRADLAERPPGERQQDAQAHRAAEGRLERPADRTVDRSADARNGREVDSQSNDRVERHADAYAGVSADRRASGDARLERRLSQLPEGHPSSPRYAEAPRRPDRENRSESAGWGADRTESHNPSDRPDHETGTDDPDLGEGASHNGPEHPIRDGRFDTEKRVARAEDSHRDEPQEHHARTDSNDRNDRSNDADPRGRVDSDDRVDGRDRADRTDAERDSFATPDVELPGDRERELPADRVRPLTDAEHADHVADVRRRLADAKAAGLETDRQHTIDEGREVWSRERRAQHDQIIDALYAAAAEVPCERTAILAGGLPGAGKTTVLREYAGIDLSRYLMINPDDVKERMATMGLVPNIEGLSPMEAAGLVHEEASHVAKRLARRAEADGKNVIWDVTLSKPASAERRITSLRAGGYTQVEAVFVDLPVDSSVRRADTRFRAGHEEYRDGNGIGGRFIFPEMILSQADDSWGSRNRANFEAVKHQFDSWLLYDNSAEPAEPRLIAKG